MGTANGIYVAMLSIILSNIFMGMGPWTIYQIVVYALLMFMTGILIKPFYRESSLINRLFLALYAAGLGLVYGFIISLFYVVTYRMPNFWAYYLQGIPYDLAHAMGNFVFYMILEPILAPIIKNKFI